MLRRASVNSGLCQPWWTRARLVVDAGGSVLSAGTASRAASTFVAEDAAGAPGPHLHRETPCLTRRGLRMRRAATEPSIRM